MNEHDEVMQRRIDWGLGEVVGGETAPDVVAAVRARLAAGDQGEDERAPAPRRHGLAAAVLLLGLGAVASVVWWQQRGETDRQADTPAPETVRGDDPVVVTSRAAIDALPPQTLAVELRNLDDAALRALVARCPQLQHLRVHANARFRRPNDPAEPVSITDDGLAAVTELGTLRRLELVGTDGVVGQGLQQLTRLQQLEALQLSYFDVGDEALAVLPRLTALRELDLTRNHGFGWPTDADSISPGLRAIVACRGLLRLNLRGCSQLSGEALDALAALADLRELDLGGRGSYRGPGTESRRQRAIDLAAALAASWQRFPPSVTDAAIGKWPQLRRLSLSENFLLTPEVGWRLRDHCPRLVDVDLSGCPGIDDSTLRALREIQSLRSLALGGCTGLSASAATSLYVMPLQHVDLTDLAWLDLPLAERLLRRGLTITAARSNDPAFNAAFAALAARYARDPIVRPELVRSVAELDALPSDITALEVRDLGDAAVPALRRRAGLTHLEFVTANASDSLTDAGLAQLATLRGLRSLRLVVQDTVTAKGLQPLTALRELRALHLNSRVDTAIAGLLPRFPALTELSLVAHDLPNTALAEVAQCRGLRKLEIAGAKQTDAAALASLGALRGLEELVLRGVAGIDDTALAGWSPLVNLRVLRIAEGNVTSAGLAVLAAMPQLRTLDLSDHPRLDNTALRHLPEQLAELRLDRVTGLTPGAGELLRQRLPHLTHLHLHRAAWLGDTDLRALLTLPELEVLGVMDCAGPTRAIVPDILACKSLRDLDATRCIWLDDDAARQLQTQRPELAVTRKVW